VQPLLEEATRKEADLLRKPFEQELKNLDAIFEDSIRFDPVPEAMSNELKTSVESDGAGKELNGSTTPKPPNSSPLNESSVKELSIHEDQSALVAAASSPQKEVSSAGPQSDYPEATVAEFHTKMDIDNENTSISIHDHHKVANYTHPVDPSDTKTTTSSVPALSYSGSTLPSISHNEPLTPPSSDKTAPKTLADGGIPWYFEPFDPVGTTIHDERWTGREVLRSMSEELSELGDDEINDLVDMGTKVKTPMRGIEKELKSLENDFQVLAPNRTTRSGRQFC
jgi:NuA3 HAT complex component NTO1